MKLGSKFIGAQYKPYFIAEMSGNHNQSLEKAIKIVEAAASTGANALKIQTYTPDTMTIDISSGEFFIEDKTSLWKGNSLYELYKVAMTPWEWHEPIKKRCEELGLDFFSTPFDASAVDFLEQLNVPFYKIASFENNDIPLIKKVAQKKKPVIISTGMASLTEISEAVDTLKSHGATDIVLLKCTSAYPAQPKDANLATIKNLRETFKVEVGLSDHTMGAAVPIAAVSLGATVIEKHFTIDRSEGGVDSAFSMEPAEFKAMISDVNRAWESIGGIHYGLTDAEKKSKIFRRSVYVIKDIEEGESFSVDNIKVIRPGLGLEPKYFDMVLGRKAKHLLKKGTPVCWENIR